MMKLIVFAVDQGLCAYVRTPNDYGILIDCGSGNSTGIASPAEWLADHEVPSLNCQGDGAVSLIVTHPHENHLKDFNTVARRLSPSPFCCDQDFNWPALIHSDDGVSAYHSWLTSCEPRSTHPDFGATVRCFSLDRKQAEQLGGDDDQMINNRSVVTVINYTSAEDYSWKIAIAGDNRTESWQALLNNPEFCAAIKGTDFFVTACHGQEIGLCSGLSKITGKPLANISCSRKGERVDARYERNAQGVKFPDGSRTHFITPDDGNLTIEMQDDGKYDVWLFKP